MTVAGVLAVAFKLACFAAIIVAGIWAYRRFRLPSVPWILTYLLLTAVLGLPTMHAAASVLDHVASDGRGPIGTSITLGEAVYITNVASGILAMAAKALIAWFILSELAFAYGSGESGGSLKFALLPRRHGYALGSALVGCAVVMPIIWTALFITTSTT